jgi:hypothetical protein
MKHHVCGAVLALFVPVMAIAPALAQGWVQPPTDGSEVILFNAGSRLCLQPEEEARINGLAIVQQPCKPNLTFFQRWTFLLVTGFVYTYGEPGIYRVANSGFGGGGELQCLDDRDGKTADWSPVQQWACNDTSTTMQWKVVAKDPAQAQFINIRSGKCLDVRAGSLAPGAALQIYRCTSTPTSPNWAQVFAW